MTEAIHNDYEVSSEGAVRHWEIPYARLTDTTPTPTNAAEVTSVLPGTQLTGTILSVDASRSIAVIDFTNSMVYRHDVRNVLTYSTGSESTFGAINIGDPVYYDNSATMPAGVYLSTSPLDNTGAANTLFGFAVADDIASDTFPKGGATASTQRVAVMQRGA
mgnify:CR=1 FL=1|jgi:hypothetical protein